MPRSASAPASAGSALAVAAVFAGRLLLALARRLRSGAARDAAPGARPAAARRSSARSAWPSPWRCPSCRSRRAISSISPPRWLIYVMLGWGLNIVVGLAGLLDLGYVAFYAVGAYTYRAAGAALRSLLLAVPAAGRRCARPASACCWAFPCCACAATISPSSRWASARSSAWSCINWVPVDQRAGRHRRHSAAELLRPALRAPRAAGASRPSPTSSASPISPIQRIIFLYYVILALALLTNLFTLRIRRLPIGRAWEALREDEIACRALGINPTQHQAVRLRHRRHVRRASPAPSSPPARASSARKASPSSNPP